MNKKLQAASLPKIVPVILAGGGGKRLFPLSTKQKPKYLLKINSPKTLLEETIERAIKIQEKINKNLNHRSSKISNSFSCKHQTKKSNIFHYEKIQKNENLGNI